MSACQASNYILSPEKVLKSTTGRIPHENKYFFWTRFNRIVRGSVNSLQAWSISRPFFLKKILKRSNSIIGRSKGEHPAFPLRVSILSFWHKKNFLNSHVRSRHSRPLWCWRPLWEILDAPLSNECVKWIIK